MTIYDVPVNDSVFFPVSGDMLRRMKHDEAQAKTVSHPAWCDECSAPIFPGEARLHGHTVGKVCDRLEVGLSQLENDNATILVTGDVELNADQVDNLIGLLQKARQKVIEQ